MKGWLIITVLPMLFFGIVHGCNQAQVQMQAGSRYYFASPYYPNAYPSVQFTCDYSYAAPEGHKVRLTCPYVDIYNSLHCQNSAFLVWKNGDLQSNSYNYFCSYFPSGITTMSDGRYLAASFANSVPNYNNQGGFLCYAEAFVSEPEATTPVAPTQPPSPPADCQCGLENRERIVGGTETRQNQYPWMVAIKWKNGRAFCGGSLISDRFVLTAAHCVESARPGIISLMLGVHDVVNPKSFVRTVDVSQIISHPQYDQISVDNDIALIRLATPVEQPFPNHIRPVCLPYGITADIYKHRTATVMGWGVTSIDSDEGSGVLLETKVDVFTSAECNRFFANVTGRVTENMFCGYKLKTDACKGDSGGPLLLNEKGFNYEIGIVSWGDDCALPNNPGVYTKVINYLDWIEQNTGQTFCKVGQ